MWLGGGARFGCFFWRWRATSRPETSFRSVRAQGPEAGLRSMLVVWVVLMVATSQVENSGAQKIGNALEI